MADSELTVRITARDDATPVVQDAARRMEQFGAQARAAGGGAASFAAQTREATLTIRAMSTGLLHELSPGLALATNQFTSATREAKGLPPALGAVVVGVAAAAIGLGQLVSSLREAATVQVQLNRAVEASDFSGATSQLRALTTQLETFSQFVPTAIQGLLDLTRTPGAFNILDRLLGRPDPALIQSAVAAIRAIAPAEMERQIADARVAQLAATRELAQFEAQRAKQFVSVEEFSRQESKLTQILIDETQAQKVLLRARADVAAAGLRAAGVPEDVVQQTVFARMAEDLETLALRADLAFSKLGVENFRGLLELAQTVNTSIKSISDPELEESLRKGLAAVREIREEAKQAAADRAGLVSSIREAELERLKIGAGAAAQAQLSLEQVAARTALAKVQVREDVNTDFKRAQIEAQGRLEAAQIAFAERVRIDPTAGFAEGLREMQDEFSAAGAIMQRVARQTATSMQRAFSDQLFDVVTGQFDDLAEAGKRMGLSIVRSLTDAVSDLVTAGTLRTLRSAFQPRLLQSVAAPLALVGGGGAGGLMVLAPASAQAGALAAGGGLPAGAAATGTLAGGAAAGAASTNVTSATLQLAGPSASLLGGATGEFLRSTLFQQSYSSTGALVGGGPTVATTLGAAAGVVGLGLTVFTGLQGEPTAANIATSAISGAISGAMIGAVGGPVGVVVGLVAGALIGGGAAAAGKGGAKARAAKRKQARTQQATHIMGELEKAVNDAAAAADAEFRAVEDVQLEGGSFRGLRQQEAALKGLMAQPMRALEAFDATLRTRRVAGGQAGAGSVIYRTAWENAVGLFNTHPWNWAPQADLAVLVTTSIGGENDWFFSVDGVQGPGEMIMAFGMDRARAFWTETARARREIRDREAAFKLGLGARLAQTRAAIAQALFGGRRAIPVAFEEVAEAGISIRRTIVPATEEGTFAGRQLETLPPALIKDRLDPDLAEEILRGLAQVDRDRNLGILHRELGIG